MARYARIIDKGECYSTRNLSINGIPANKWEWQKYNFYPKNGMVGELLYVQGEIVLKILEGVYVQMSPKGIQEITYQEYEKEKVNNVCNGMDERQTRINEQTDAIDDIIRIIRNGGL